MYPGGRADQAADGVLLHVLGHVDADEVVFAVEERFGQGLAQLGFAHAGGAQEDEAADGPLGILDAGPGADDRVGDEADGFVLADHPFVQRFVQGQQLVALALDQPGHGDAGPAADDVGDLFVGDLVAEQTRLRASASGGGHVGRAFFVGFGGGQLLFQVGQGAVLQLGGFVQVVGLLGVLDLQLGLLDLFAQLLAFVQLFALGLPPGPHGVGGGAQVGQLLLQVFQTQLAGVVGFFLERGLFDLQLHDAAGQLIELGGHAVHLGADQRAGLVDQVDGLVGQEAVGDVAVALGGGGHEGGVQDLDAVEDLEAFAQAAQDADGVFDGGLVDQHRLEAAFERGVLLDVLAVLVEGGGADAVQLAAGEHGLEQVARVHGAVGLAGADDGVQLVDEEHDAAVGLLDLGEHGLEAFFELAAELGAGDERAQVEAEDGFVFEPVGHVAAHDALGQALGDGGFAHAGLADEHGVVLGFAREDADGAADLFVAADDRVELAVAGGLHQVAAVFLEAFVGAFGVVAGDPLAAAHVGQGGGEGVGGDAQVLEGLRAGGLAVVQYAQHQVLDAEVVVLHRDASLFGGGQGAGQFGGDRHLAAAPRDRGALGQLALQFFGDHVGGAVELVEQPRDQAVGLVNEGEQQVLGVHGLVAELGGHGLGALQRLAGFLREFVHIHAGDEATGVPAPEALSGVLR